MTTDYQGPTPPPELVEQWRDEAFDLIPDDDYPCPCDIDDARDQHIATQAARWGADQELEACVEWLPSDLTIDGESLRDVRRPKPSSLAEEALKLVSNFGVPFYRYTAEQTGTIRRALERLQELENND